MVLRSDPTLLVFLEEAPHVEAASRGTFCAALGAHHLANFLYSAVSFPTVMASVETLVAGVALVKEEVRVLKRIRISPAGDRFISVMEVRPARLPAPSFRANVS